MRLAIGRNLGAGPIDFGTASVDLGTASAMHHPRFRVARARVLRVAVYRATLILALVSIASSAPLFWLYPGPGTMLAALGAVEAAMWAMFAILARRIARRYLPALTALVALLVLPGPLLTIATLPAQYATTVAYLALIPLAVALFVPWGSRAHGLWLLAYVSVTAAFAASPLAASFSVDDRLWIVLAVAVAGLVSYVGHGRSQQSGVREFAEQLRLRTLNDRLRATSSELQRLNDELQGALDQVHRLEGLLAICAGCKAVRDEGGSWVPVERYVGEHSEARFSHGLCPDCVRRLYPEMADEILRELENP